MSDPDGIIVDLSIPLVVHFIESSDACISEIPAILNGQMPSNPNSTLGTGNISDRPVAVILGGGFDDAFDMVYNEVERALGPSGSGVPWLRNDTNKPGPGDLGPGYGTVAAQRMKQVLGELRVERQSGLIRTGPTGVYWY